MRSRLIRVAALSLATVVFAAAADNGVVIWKSADLKGYQQKLAPKMNEAKVATETIGNFGNHFPMIAHREATGEAEVHESFADLFVIQTGEATLVTGGALKNSKSISQGELRAPSIDGGESRKLGPGDVVHIPAKVPHHLLVDKGKQVTYFVMKIESK